MATRLSFEAPKASVDDQNRPALPMLQRHGHVSEHLPESVSDEAAASTNTSQAPLAIEGRLQGTQRLPNCLWLYREQLISLFWEQDLPLRRVQEVMKEEHGLNFRSAITSLMSYFPPSWMLSMVHSTKVYRNQFRRWGIRKNLKGHEALEIASGKETSSIFWPDDRVDIYAARIDRHVRKKRRQNRAKSHAHAGTVTAPSRRLRAPDALEKVEAASYYLNTYFNGNHNSFLSTWFLTGPSFGEQEAFSSLFIGGLVRLSRNDQQQQAFKEINLAFEHLKQLVSLDHPLVYLRLMASVAAFGQYPKSEICLAVCRTLSDYLGKLSRIVHGPCHPLNHAWGESLLISAADGPESFALGVAANSVRRCWPSEPRIRMGSIDTDKCVPSDARGLDEASLRDRLSTLASCPDLLSQAQEIRLALCELLITQVRMPEALHFFAEAKAFQATDPIRRASKTFWMAELEWRSGNAQASINTLKSALASDEIATAGETNNEATETMKREIEDILCHRQNLLALGENQTYGSLLVSTEKEEE
ncbi:hypothetical protein diail_5295 [Diaporthe ilicicola]|nr:hypothetical protein diail_5295 [Diaporthe ilicicola]